MVVKLSLMKTQWQQAMVLMKLEAKMELGKQIEGTWNSGGTHPFSWLSVLKILEATHVNNDFTPITIFLLFFNEVTKLLAGQATYSEQSW